MRTSVHGRTLSWEYSLVPSLLFWLKSLKLICNYLKMERCKSLHPSTLTMQEKAKPNKCYQCNFSSTSGEAMRRHMKNKHSGEKPKKCSQCDFASLHVSNLMTHMKKHTGEKPYQCNQCNFASVQKGNLKAHLKIHSGEKSNKCNKCDYASSRTDHLRQHLKIQWRKIKQMQAM